MLNVDTLKCELARLAVLYTQRLVWGFNCDLDTLLCKIYTIRNQIAILENLSSCKVRGSILSNISICINQINVNSQGSFCRNC